MFIFSDNQHTYSEIFKYDVENERFRLFQKILTHGCRDIKAFNIYLDGEEEHFLAVANTGEKGRNIFLDFSFYSIHVIRYFCPTVQNL